MACLNKLGANLRPVQYEDDEESTSRGKIWVFGIVATVGICVGMLVYFISNPASIRTTVTGVTRTTYEELLAREMTSDDTDSISDLVCPCQNKVKLKGPVLNDLQGEKKSTKNVNMIRDLPGDDDNVVDAEFGIDMPQASGFWKRCQKATNASCYFHKDSGARVHTSTCDSSKANECQGTNQDVCVVQMEAYSSYSCDKLAKKMMAQFKTRSVIEKSLISYQAFIEDITQDFTDICESIVENQRDTMEGNLFFQQMLIRLTHKNTPQLMMRYKNHQGDMWGGDVPESAPTNTFQEADTACKANPAKCFGILQINDETVVSASEKFHGQNGYLDRVLMEGGPCWADEGYNEQTQETTESWFETGEVDVLNAAYDDFFAACAAKKCTYTESEKPAASFIKVIAYGPVALNTVMLVCALIYVQNPKKQAKLKAARHAEDSLKSSFIKEKTRRETLGAKEGDAKKTSGAAVVALGAGAVALSMTN